MWIVLCDPFLIKVFLKKEVCESHEQCMRPTRKHWNVLLNEKKNMKHRHTTFQQYPNGYLLCSLLLTQFSLSQLIFPLHWVPPPLHSILTTRNASQNINHLYHILCSTLYSTNHNLSYVFFFFFHFKLWLLYKEGKC